VENSTPFLQLLITSLLVFNLDDLNKGVEKIDVQSIEQLHLKEMCSMQH